jgi:hypothetical protein
MPRVLYSLIILNSFTSARRHVLTVPSECAFQECIDMVTFYFSLLPCSHSLCLRSFPSKESNLFTEVLALEEYPIIKK